MYEPTWVSPGKLASAWAEGAATILTATGLLVAIRARRHRQSPHRSHRSLPRQATPIVNVPYQADYVFING